MAPIDMFAEQKLLALCATTSLLIGCTNGEEPASAPVAFTGEIPSPPENSDHGYLVEDDRIPELSSCEEWQEFWIPGGPAISFAVAEGNAWVDSLAVSTEIYLKNRHLDTNGDGIVCESENVDNLADSVGEGSPSSLRSAPLVTCQLQKGPENEIGIGLPRGPRLVSANGIVRGLVLFVEFTDIKVSTPLEEDFEIFTQGFIEYFERNSYGRLALEMDYLGRVVPIPNRSDKYGMQTWGEGDEVQYFLDGIRNADPNVDYSKYDFVVVLPPYGIREIAHGPAIPFADASGVLSTAEATELRGIVGGSDFRKSKDKGWFWLAHEFGHVLGMGHPYEGASVPWDLMDNSFSELAPDLYGWHRFQNGWFVEEEVLCVDSPQSADPRRLVLHPLSSLQEGVKFVLLKTGPHTALALEYRTGGDQNTLGPEDSGLLVYTVDSTRGFEGGIQQVQPVKKRSLGIGQQGDSFSHDGVTIEIVSITPEGMELSIK